jgi:regulator of sigma E protease
VFPVADDQKSYKIGVQFALNPQLSEQGITPFLAAKEGFSTCYLASTLTIKALGKFLTNPFESDQLAGPLTIAKTAKTSADQGWKAALAFLAGLSVSVGVLNLLPVPVLDGGQVLYHLGRSTLLRLGLISVLNLSHPNTDSKAVVFDKIWLAIGLTFVVLLTFAAFYTDFMRLMSAQ